MIVWNGGRGTGKTHLLVAWLRRGGSHIRRIIIEPDESTAANVRRQYGLTRNQCMSAQEWSRSRYADFDVEVAVDNLDLWLMSHFGNVALATTSHPITTEHMPDTRGPAGIMEF